MVKLKFIFGQKYKDLRFEMSSFRRDTGKAARILSAQNLIEFGSEELTRSLVQVNHRHF